MFLDVKRRQFLTYICKEHMAETSRSSELVLADNGHGLSLIHEADKQSSDGIASDQPTSAKSDISVEISLDTKTRDSKQMTESSCSNSLFVVPSVSPLDQSYQAVEERVTASSESGVSAPANESSESSKTQTSKVSDKDHDASLAGFDLNKDINANEADDSIQPTGSSHRVIHVVAKAGILNGQPMTPLKFEGGGGWKGFAETSAFRPTRSKHSRGFTGIDLNLEAVEDNGSENDSKRTKNSWFDLNNASDEFTQSEDHHLLDLNLNANTSVGNNASHSTNRGKRDSNLSTCEANNSHTMMVAPNIVIPTELMQRAAFLHHNSEFMSHGLPPPHYYSTTSPFHFGSRHPSSFPLNGIMPYAGYPQEHGIFLQALNHGTVYTTFSSPHLVQVVREQNGIGHDVRSNEAGKFPFLSRNNPTVETMHRESWHANRKEPEGGLECYYKN